MSFSSFGNPTTKVVLLGKHLNLEPRLLSVLRSLNCEHIALGEANSLELGVPRNILAPSNPRSQAVSAVQRWFFRRKADSGFILSGFPASLAEAEQWDCWLETRGEILDVCLFPQDASTGQSEDVLRHYALQGVLWRSTPSAPIPEWMTVTSLA